MKKIIFNPDYFLRHDIKRTFIINKGEEYNSTYGWASMIHPLHAMIFTFFTKNEDFNTVIKKLSNFLDINKNEIINIISPFINNNQDIYVEYNNNKFSIPKNVLIEIKNNVDIKYQYEYNYEDFFTSEFDFKTKRYISGPLNITFMPNNICLTDCIYCYADKKHKVKNYVSLKRVKKIIDEAYNLKILDFSVVGGEIFTYPKWKELLKYIKNKKFNMIRISTKIPIKLDDIRFLKNININEIQISLDSLIYEEMKIMLKVKKDYPNKIKETISNLVEEGFKVTIATILTKYNSSYNSINSIYNFLKDIKINEWVISPGFESIYKPEQSFRAKKEELEKIFKHIELIKNNSRINITSDKTFFDREYKKVKGGSENFQGAECSSLISHMFILPDGKVTICEQLYWIPNFIIGDINTQSIVDIWNSDKSMSILNLKQTDIQDSSPCKTCKIFDKCHNNMNKCWADTIKSYGIENWDYPDPRCIFAPKLINDINFS